MNQSWGELLAACEYRVCSISVESSKSVVGGVHGGHHAPLYEYKPLSCD